MRALHFQRFQDTLKANVTLAYLPSYQRAGLRLYQAFLLNWNLIMWFYFHYIFYGYFIFMVSAISFLFMIMI